MSRAIGCLFFCAIIVGYGSIAYSAGNANAGNTKSAACAGCHGPDGTSMAPLFPRLAGQHAKYLSRQLSDFKSQKRTDPSMQAMAAGLSSQEIEDLGAFYAARKPAYPASGKQQSTGNDQDTRVTEESLAAGKTVFIAGNEATGVAACGACHGPAGEGNGPAGFPMLKGQNLPYLIKALNDFKEGIRSNDDGAMMRTIAGKMSKAEINAVSAYLSKLR
ncbi:MAG: c-type cytochrome [Methylococcales bacterium]